MKGHLPALQSSRATDATVLSLRLVPRPLSVQSLAVSTVSCSTRLPACVVSSDNNKRGLQRQHRTRSVFVMDKLCVFCDVGTKRYKQTRWTSRFKQLADEGNCNSLLRAVKIIGNPPDNSRIANTLDRDAFKWVGPDTGAHRTDEAFRVKCECLSETQTRAVSGRAWTCIVPVATGAPQRGATAVQTPEKMHRKSDGQVSRPPALRHVRSSRTRAPAYWRSHPTAACHKHSPCSCTGLMQSWYSTAKPLKTAEHLQYSQPFKDCRAHTVQPTL
jgi:hypothetical protein